MADFNGSSPESNEQHSPDQEVDSHSGYEDPVSPVASPDGNSYNEARGDSPSGDGSPKGLYEDDVDSSNVTEHVNSSPTRDSPAQSPAASPQSGDEIKTTKKRAIVDDSDEEDDGPGPSSGKRALIDSDDSDGEKSSPKKRAMIDDSDDEDDNGSKKKQRNLFGDSSDDEAPKRGEDDEFVERNDISAEDDAPKPQSDDDDGANERRPDSDDDDDMRGGGRGRGFEWDFDLMLREKKAERKNVRRRKGKDGGIDIINDDDGMVSGLVERMKSAAKADRNANIERKPAFQKIRLLPEVKAMLLKAGIVDALIENGFMSALSEWLAPLPDKCLPALDIRMNVLKLLHTPRFWKLDRSTLKQSGLGKAVMMLYKHPHETKENKAIANKLIGEWARPIFQLDTDYSTMSREDRVVRDFDRMPAVKKQRVQEKRSRNDSDSDDEDSGRRRPKIKESGELGPTSSGLLKPGDKGYINRARVPKPSTKDYVIRPKWNIDGECKERKATGTRRYDQALREFQDRTKKSNPARSVSVSLEGRNLQI